MPASRSIDIDFDIHRTIELNRKGFEESPNDVLRRLLGLDRLVTAPASKASSGRHWRGQGVELPHGSQLRMSYNGSTFTGLIDDGAWLIEGVRHSTPSGAAIAVARTRSGGRTNLNGWNYWQALMPGQSTWIPLNQLWREANLRNKAS